MFKTLTIRNVGIIFIIATAIMASAFVVAATLAAPHKLFWGDELHDLGQIENDGYWKMIVEGPADQLTNSPLHFLFFKFMYNHKNVGQMLGMPDTLYFRLFTIFFALISGLFVVGAAFVRFKKEALDAHILLGQGFLLLAALAYYYFNPYLFRYVIETRPYCLWYSLWFVLLSLLMIRRDFKWEMVILLVALAATMTISVFQIFSLAVAFFCVHYFYTRRESGALLRAVVMTTKFFIIPVVVIVFYLIQPCGIQKYSQTLALAGFCKYWMSSFGVPAVAVIALYMAWGKKEYKGNMIAMLAVLILFLMGPIIIYLTLQRHVYFEARHYIYNRLVYPLFLVHIAILLPGFLRDRVNLWSKAKIKVYIIFACCFIPLYALQYIFAEYGAIKTVRLNEAIPTNYHDLVALVEEGKKPTRRLIQPYLDYYEKLIRYIPTLAEGHAMRAFCQYQLGQIQQAISGYEKAIALAPGFYWYHFNLAVIYFNEGQYGKAVDSLNRLKACDMGKALEFVAASTRIYLPIRQTYLQDYQHSMEDQVKAGHKQADRMYILSQFYLQQYLTVVAFGDQVIALTGDPDGFMAYYVGRALFELKLYDQSSRYMMQALKVSPQCVEGYRYLSSLLKLGGRVTEADDLQQVYETLKKQKPLLPWQEKRLPLQVY